MMISTSGNGSSTSSILPCSNVILSDMPLAATISRALRMIVDISTPMTCFAPAFTANLQQSSQQWAIRGRWNGCRAVHAIGTDVHAEDGCTASHIQHHLVLEDVPVVVYCVAVRSCADFIFLCGVLAGSHGCRYLGYQPTFPRECLQ